MEGALEMAGQPVKRGTMAHDHDVYILLADIAAQQRDADAVLKYAPRAEALATRDGHKLYLAIAYRARGVAHRLSGEPAEAAACLERAMELFTELGTRWQIGRTLGELAEIHRAGPDPDTGWELLVRSIAEFEAIGAAPDAKRARGVLETRGVPGGGAGNARRNT